MSINRISSSIKSCSDVIAHLNNDSEGRLFANFPSFNDFKTFLVSCWLGAPILIFSELISLFRHPLFIILKLKPCTLTLIVMTLVLLRSGVSFSMSRCIFIRISTSA